MTEAAPIKSVHTPHWYKITYQECPLCGRSETYRERVYGEKPPPQESAPDFRHWWCGCDW